MTAFGFVKTVTRLGEGIFMRLSDAADRWFVASFGQSFGIPNAQILATAVRMVNWSRFVHRLAITQSCSKASRTKSVLAERETRPRTLRSAYVPKTNATTTKPCQRET